MNESKPMKPSELITRVLELRRKYQEGLQAKKELDALYARLEEVLEPLEGKIVNVWLDYGYQPFLVDGCGLIPYEKPEVVYVSDLDKLVPEEVVANGHPDPLRIHDLDTQVA